MNYGTTHKRNTMFGIRKTVKSVVKSVLGLNENPARTQTWEAPDLSQVTTTPPVSQNSAAELEHSEPEPSEFEEPSAEEVAIPASTSSTPDPVEEGMELTVENVEEIIGLSRFFGLYLKTG